MDTGWSKRRKMLYGAGVLITILALGIYFFRDTLFPTPTCFDQKQNGYEGGVDCGGICNLRCSQEIVPLSVKWSRAVKTGQNSYDLMALVSHKNIDSAPHGVRYLFTVFSKSGKEIKQIEGSTIVPLGDFPVVKQNVELLEEPGEVSITLASKQEYYKTLENPSSPSLRVSNTRYEQGSIPRVYAMVTNTTRIPFRDVPVRVVLYDLDGNAYAGGETIISSLAKESSQEVVFTWNDAFPLNPAKISVYPILDPFLGSQ